MSDTTLAGVPTGDARPFTIDYGIDVARLDIVSFDDVLNNRFDPNLIAGRSILIGATALELGDLLSTPHSPAMPGVLVHALGYESLMQDRALTSPSRPWMVFLGLVVLLLGEVAGRKLRLSRLFAACIALVPAVIAASFLLQAILPVSPNTSVVLFALVWGFGLAAWREFTRRKRELAEQQAAHLNYMARHDSETGMPNRRAMLETLDAVRPAAGQGSLLIVALGIERYGELRGAIGYANAIDLIPIVAAGLRGAGLDGEFYHLDASVIGTVIPFEDEDAAQSRISNLNALVQQTVVVAGQSIDIDLRAGVIVAMDASMGAEPMLERAALSLDHARQTGRHVVCWGDAEFEDPQLKLALLTEISVGLTRGEFHLLYQPKMCTRTNTILGVEALMRWSHPKFGPISPDHFILVAEETGAIDDLTVWAVKQAISDQVAMRSAGIDVSVAVNMSARSLSDLNFCQRVIGMVVRSGAAIKIEITETAIIQNSELAIRSVNAFREAGIMLAIDDYGAGQSSIAYLKRLPAHELKLDRCMIVDVKDSQRDRMILKSTFDLAHALNMRVVCEGVEDAETFAALAALGCDAIQGYFIGRPMVLDEFVSFWRARQSDRSASIAS